MTILILSWRGPDHPSAGGAEQSTWQHAKGWVKAGHQVTLLTAAFVGCQPKETKDGINILRLGDQFIVVRLAAFFWYWFGKHQSIDLVVDEFHGIPFFTPVWACKSKILGLIHEVAQPVWALNPWPKPFNLIPAIIGKYGEPWMFRLFYKHIPFMTVSESTQKDLELFGVKKITVVHNGVTLPKKLPKFDKEKTFTIIYLSALAKDKGIEDAIKVFNLLKTKIKNIQLWVVGKGIPSYVVYLQKLCPEAKFWGFVSEELKFELLARAHVLLFPSVHEGWGLVNIEANSCGLPVVGYNVHGIRDSLLQGKSGLLVPYGDINALSQACVKIKNNFIQEGDCKKWAAKFNWLKAQKQSLCLIQELFS